MTQKRIGYLRVSTAEQRPDRQIDGLKHVCDKLYIEKLSAVARVRPVYARVMAKLRPGDIFVIWDIDRAFRNARDALNELYRLREAGIGMHIANFDIDVRTPHGELLFTVASGLAQFEHRYLSQRTNEGLAAARKRGRRFGRPPKLTTRQIERAARILKAQPERMHELAAHYDVHPWTISRSIKRHAQRKGKEKTNGLGQRHPR